MAIPKVSSHTRSISLPSLSHSRNTSIEDQLCWLSASQAGPSSSSSICRNLTCIKVLYEQMSNLINFPDNQKILSLEPHRGEVEEVLDGSLALTDSEGTHVYMMSRKSIYKTISKCLANLKKVEKRFTWTMQQNDSSTVRMLKEAQAISLSTLKSLLSCLMGKKSISQTRGLSMVAKLVKSKSMPDEFRSEVEDIDHALRAGAETKAFLKQLETLQMAFYELEDALESVSRRLVKTRVSLLNVLNH
ncbi:hypothetical protein Cgig2_031965 [Carnegiea gigantea]|uniref:Uncharacterized protein n=1 Tax=Carnegiea gigantea TaxID=171969 RepID=A0A9Q1QD81_9CARY|nr:hypothetical protein Cgig2_031965 [Carnegiea gigantea]